VYLAGAAGPAANLALLQRMLSTSRDLATLLGYPSYAHYKAADATLAGTPDAVVPFLEGLAAEVKPLADANVKVVWLAMWCLVVVWLAMWCLVVVVWQCLAQHVRSGTCPPTPRPVSHLAPNGKGPVLPTTTTTTTTATSYCQ
jgi:hypothetical protein